MQRGLRRRSEGEVQQGRRAIARNGARCGGRERVDAMLAALGNGLFSPFHAAIDAIAAMTGRVIVTEWAKSRPCRAQVAATVAPPVRRLTSCIRVGEPASGHDSQRDVFALSWSGETANCPISFLFETPQRQP